MAKILLFESVAGLGFSFGKGEHDDVPDKIAADLVKAGLGKYIGNSQKPHERAQTATSQQPKKAEKR
jgi:hypothetical protein